MDGQCQHLQQDIRGLLSRLHPAEARAAGFGVSLRGLIGDLVRSWNDRLGEQTRFALRFETNVDIPDDVALTIYRLSQEALTNSVRHARAANVLVSLADDGNGRVSWSVEDDGTGIGDDSGSLQLGNGLAGMRERAWALGSDLEIGPAQPAGGRPGLRLAAAFLLAR